MTLRTIVAAGILAALARGQVAGVASNVLFAAGNNLDPAGQEILVSPDGSYIAVLGNGGTGDMVITEIDRDGTVLSSFDVPFPAGNEINPVNGGLVISRRGSFLCAYGTDTALGDLVFISRDPGGAWFTLDVAFPGANDVPLVGTRPVISRDESFIACRGASAADLVIVPVDTSAGFPQPGTPFNVALPAGNDIPGIAIDPVITPDGRALAVPGTLADGDLAILTIGRPVTSGNTVATNVSFPAANGIANILVPVAASPRSNFFCVHGQQVIGDLVVIPLAASGAPEPAVNVLWPAGANTGSGQVPPAISGDGRLVAVNGTLIAGDVVLLPVAADGTPGTPVNVAFPGNGFVTGTQLPPVLSNDARLVLQRGPPTIGDLVALQVSFTSDTTITVTGQNVLYPGNNNLPDAGSGIVLAPDRSFCATFGSATVGDLVLTAFDAEGVAQTPENVLYPANNNVTGTAGTPALSEDGLLLLTRGSTTIGDAVVTMIEVDPATGLVRSRSVTNVLYPSNNSFTSAAPPRFAPSAQFFVSAGAPLIGDLVVVQLVHVAPHLLAPFDLGTDVAVRFFSPADPGRAYVAGAALGRWPGIPLPGARRIPLEIDPLLEFSLTAGNPVFLGFDGVLDASGIAQGTIALPEIPGAEGFWFYLAFIVLDPAASLGIGTISEATTCVLR